MNEDIIETLRRIQCSDVACGNLRIAMGLKLAIYEIERVRAERDAALSVVNEFISDTTFKNQTPDHECEFKYSPETGKCDACEAWGNYIELFCSREDEEENTQ